jgi:hypothetical protein
MAMLSDVTSYVTPSSINGNIKINGVETTIYKLPIPLSPSIIAQDGNNQFVTIGEKTNWNAAFSDAHMHPNKALLDTYTQTDSNISSAISLMHSPLTIGSSNGLSLSGQQLSLSLANSSNSGAISSADWNTFNNKVDKISDETIGGNKTFTGITTINNNLNINGNIYYNGVAYETHAQQVYTTDDLIILRYGAISGLPSSGVTGFTAKLYNGLHDGQLVFDNTGTARVGDIGSLQPLATREEIPIDQGFAYWNKANFKFKTKLLTTNDVSEGSNLYFTSGRAINSTLSGYTVGANTSITASDTILSAFEKTQGQINNLQNSGGTTNSACLPLSGGTLNGLLIANSGLTVNGALSATTGTFSGLVKANNGLTVTGNATATSFIGGGSNLTSLPTNTSLYPTLNQDTTGKASNITSFPLDQSVSTTSNTTFNSISSNDGTSKISIEQAGGTGYIEVGNSAWTASAPLQICGYSGYNLNSLTIKSLSTTISGGLLSANNGFSSTTGYFGGLLTANNGLNVNGNIQATGEVTAYTTSDKRLKKNIKTIDNALDIINKIRPVSFNWNDKAKELNSSKTDTIEFGMIAQELEKILPNTVKNMYDGKYKGINYIQIIPYLIAAIQELTEEINILKNKYIKK